MGGQQEQAGHHVATDLNCSAGRPFSLFRLRVELYQNPTNPSADHNEWNMQEQPSIHLMSVLPIK